MQQEHSQIKSTNKQKWKLDETQIQKISVLFFDRKWSKSRIAKHLSVDHTTVIYHINKYLELRKSFKKNKPKPVEAFVEIKKSKYHSLLQAEEDEPVNAGMDYEDYLDVQRARDVIKQDACDHQKVIFTYKCTDCGKLHTGEMIVDKSFHDGFKKSIIRG